LDEHADGQMGEGRDAHAVADLHLTLDGGVVRDDCVAADADTAAQHHAVAHDGVLADGHAGTDNHAFAHHGASGDSHRTPVAAIVLGGHDTHAVIQARGFMHHQQTGGDGFVG